MPAARTELPGEPSRRLMHEAIERALRHLRAHGEPSAVLLIDVEQPEGAGNGHLLRAVAERLGATLTPDDLVTRFGGDVLVAVVRHVADEAAAYEVATRLQLALESAPRDGGRPSISIGCSLVREQDPSADTVVARADGAMYAARNKASRDARPGDCSPESERSELVESAFERSSIEDFDVYYQPIADLACGSVAAVEAILRWEHPHLGTIAPSEFVPIAERHGQIVTLGRSVIEKACAQTVRWGPARDGHPLRTCVNISPAQIADPEFVDDVQAALAHSGATACRLAFELSEETIAAAPQGALQALADVRIELIFDHAGTTLPTQTQVAGGPIAMIKLDRSFVASGSGAGRTAALAQAAMLARSLRLPAVAKGVETLDQLASVREHELPLAQGHLFSRPQSAPLVERLVFSERPFARLLAPRPSWLDLPLKDDGAAAACGAPDPTPARDEPVVVIGAPDVP